MMQQDIMGHKVGTYEKIDWLQQTLAMLISGMDFLSTNRIKEWNESLEDDIKDVNEDLPPGSQRKGIFRDPLYAAGEIQKTESKKNVEVVGTKKIDDANWVRHKEDVQSLKHLKLSFSVYKEDSDNLEWIRDCEEYFSIYEVQDKRRPAIAAMHLIGSPDPGLSPL